ncbi:TPA: glycosyltransferase family 2 protein [Escherichia coli]
MKTDITAMSENIVGFFEKTTLRDHIKKTWLYNQNCFVIDFEYKGVKFALDFTASQPGVNVDFVLRNNCPYYTIKGNAKKENISSSAVLTTALHTSLLKITTVINEINSIYPFDVSVVIPVHNRETLILECIKSLNNQTIDKNCFEVIFIDDCSTDRSIAAIEYNISREINYRIIRREVGSGNASAPRNEGIKSAKGRYVFFLDSDDSIHSDLLSDGIQMAYKNNSDIVYFKQVSPAGRGVPVRPFKKNIDKADIVNNHLFRSLRIFKLFKKELLTENTILFNPSIPVFEDILFTCQALTFAERVSILADKGYCILNGHEQPHLSKVSYPIEKRILVLQTGLFYILSSKKNEAEIVKMFNAWLVICIEHLTSMLSKKSLTTNEKSHIFNLIHKSFLPYTGLVNESQIYPAQRELVSCLICGDYSSFCEKI